MRDVSCLHGSRWIEYDGLSDGPAWMQVVTAPDCGCTQNRRCWAVEVMVTLKDGKQHRHGAIVQSYRLALIEAKKHAADGRVVRVIDPDGRRSQPVTVSPGGSGPLFERKT